ncbi:MAG: hypothetical protein JST48_12165 [Bacteroidetes bacterium]|nr:hypothetical protein [Bacteroidota bacterium]
MTTSHKNVAFLIIALMLLTLVGFYPTYISKFPTFEDITNVHHFHGAMMMIWFLLLIIQPFLISYKKYKIHRTLGKASYVIAPVVAYSIFLATQHEYYLDTTYQTKDESLAGLAWDITSMISFVVCYILAIINRKNTELHMRYMVGTALIIMGPGVMRIIAVYEIFGDIKFPIVALYTFIICAGIGVGLIAYDLMKNRPYKPYLVVVGLTTGIYVTYFNRMSDWWLAIAGAIATTF